MSSHQQPPEQDRHFDDLAVRFAEKIYGGNKGAIRLAVLQADLAETLPSQQSLRVLDIGAGLGHMALWLARQGHHVVLAEPSAPMLEQAQKSFIHAGCQAEFIQADWQQLCQQQLPPFDLIICHAVLEWLVEPAALTAAIPALLKKDGWLSLAFYNKDALIFQNLIKGNLRKLKKQRFAGEAGGLTPQQPIDPHWLASTLTEQGWNICQRSGIRVFHDYMRPEFRQKITDNDLVSTELEYRRHPALAAMGRYLHWLCQRSR